MVIFQLTGINVPITIQANTINYDQRLVDGLEPAIQVAFVAIVDGIKAYQPDRQQYEPDTAMAWYRYIEANNNVTLISHQPPPYVEGRIY